MSRRHILFAALKRMGAFKKKHNSKMNLTLGLHLMNTYEDLIRRGVDEEVALAGGLHSIYGTNAFQNATATQDKRIVLQKLFSERVERLGARELHRGHGAVDVYVDVVLQAGRGRGGHG